MPGRDARAKGDAVSNRRERVVVVGNGMAAARALEELHRRAPERYEVDVFSAEPHGAYNRILLSSVLAGEKKLPDIVTHTPSWYAERNIRLHRNEAVVSVNREARRLRTADGRALDYDRLLLATGSTPFILPVPGRELPGVIGFRDIADVETMLEASRELRYAVVIGGGLLGLEAAHGLMKRGMQVTVVHLIDRVLERQLDAPASQLLRAHLEKQGLRFRMPAKTAALLGGKRVRAVAFEDGSEIPADLVVMAAGIVPNATLARSMGLDCERGIVVDDTLQTSDPAISALGECAQHRKTCYGLVAPLYEQAAVWARRLAGEADARYEGSVVATRLKVTGVNLYSAGAFMGGERGDDLVFRDPRRGVYKRLVMQDNRLAGAVLYGDTRDAAWYYELLSSQRDVGPLRQRLLFGQAYARPVLRADPQAA